MNKELFDFIFLTVLMLINAAAFIPQTVKIWRLKTSAGVSPLTYIIFLVIQCYLVFHSFFYNADYPLAIGYFISMITCSSVLISIFLFRDKRLIPKLPVETYQAFSQFPGHLYIKDKQGKGLWCNTNNAVDFGLTTSDEFIGTFDNDLFDKNEALKIREADEAVMQQEKLVIVEETVSIDGKTRLYQSLKYPLKDSIGNIVGIIGNSIDITDAKKATSEKLAMLENIIAAMPGYVYWMNRDGVYLGCNDREAEVIGLSSRRDIIGKRNVDMPGFLIAEELDPVNEQIMSTGKAVTLEEPAKLPDGTDGIFISSKTPLKNSDNEVIGLLGISIDITDRKTMENELIVAKEKAEVANKAKEEFLYNMRHDIRTPFSGITGMATLLKTRETDQEKLQYINNIATSAEELLDYLNTILEFTQSEEGSVPVVSKQINLKECIQSCINMFTPSIESQGIHFTYFYSEDLSSEYFTDEFRVQRIVMNLLGNAIKFTNKEGNINLSLELVGNKPGSRESLIRLTVQDNGIGIPADKQAIIFEKFERLTSSYKGQYKGTGLGLHAVRTLVHDLEGDVTVTSEEGDGATFICNIPMIQPKEGEYVSQKKNKEKDLQDLEELFFSESPDVLLVEDGDIMQIAATSLLESLGCFVDIADTGEKAVDMCKNKTYDLVFMDIGLPEIDGYEATRQIRQINMSKDIPIVALTAHATNEVDSVCSEVGMNSVLSKPITKDKAIWVLSEFIQQYHAVDNFSENDAIEMKDYSHINTKIIDMPESVKQRSSDYEALHYLFMLKDSMIVSLKKMKECLDKDDIKAFGKEAHKLKGTLSVVTLPALQDSVEKLNEGIKGKRDGSIELLYQSVETEFNRFANELKKLPYPLTE